MADAQPGLGEGRYVHTINAKDGAKPAPAPDARPPQRAGAGGGYRPHRRTAKKRKPR